MAADHERARVPGIIHAPPVRALGKHILVYVVPRVTRVGLIDLPEGSYLKAEDLAVVVSVGAGAWRKSRRVPHEIMPGEVVMVVRIHEITRTNKQVQERLGKGFFFMLESDLICVRDDLPRVRIERDSEMGFGEWLARKEGDGHVEGNEEGEEDEEGREGGSPGHGRAGVRGPGQEGADGS